jgi:hypothetical protein
LSFACRIAPRDREIACHAGNPPAGVVAIILLKLDTDILPSQKSGGDEAAARSGEGVEDDIS